MALHFSQPQASSISPARDELPKASPENQTELRRPPSLLLQIDSHSPASPPAVWTPDRVYALAQEDPSPFSLDAEALDASVDEEVVHSALELESSRSRQLEFPDTSEGPLAEDAVAEHADASATRKAQAESARKRFQAVVAVVVYMFCSIFAVFWLKFLVADSMPVPLFLSWIQQGVGVSLQLGATAAVHAFSERCSSGSDGTSALQLLFPPVHIRVAGLVRVLPLSFCFVCMIGLSNLCLQLLDVSVYQIARSTTLVFSLVLSAIFLRQRHSWTSCCAAMVVSFGFGLMTVLESPASKKGQADEAAQRGFVGLLLGAMASFFQALYMVLMKKTIQALRQTDATAQGEGGSSGGYERITTQDDASGECQEVQSSTSETKELEMAPLASHSDPEESEDGRSRLSDDPPKEPSPQSRAMDLRSPVAEENPRSAEATCMLYNMINALALFPFAVLLSPEPQILLRLYSEGHFFSFKTWAQLTALGSVTFVLGASIFWAVSLTSPLSVTFVGYGKTLLQTAFALLVWKEKLSPVGAVGFALTLGGSLWYSVGKMREGPETAAQKN